MGTQGMLVALVLCEAGIFLLMCVTVLSDLLGRSREHQSGLVSQVETFLGAHAPGEQPLPFTHSLRASAIAEFDRFGWRGGAKMIATAWLTYLVVSAMTVGSLALTSTLAG